MTDQGGRYRINWVAEQTGIPETTLRAWERRYRVPEPARTPSGYRVYSASDVQKVRRMRELCEGGMSPSEAALAIAEQKPRPVESGDELRLSQTLGPEHVGRTGVLSLASALKLMEGAAVALTSGRLGLAVVPIACGALQLESPAKIGESVTVTAWLESLGSHTAVVEVELSVSSEGGSAPTLSSARIELELEHKAPDAETPVTA